jgi:hypothetical protein
MNISSRCARADAGRTSSSLDLHRYGDARITRAGHRLNFALDIGCAGYDLDRTALIEADNHRESLPGLADTRREVGRPPGQAAVSGSLPTSRT